MTSLCRLKFCLLPFHLVKRKIVDAGGKPVLREGKGKLGPVITDNGNAILDSIFW